jgi:site-specific recombinase XerD
MAADAAEWLEYYARTHAKNPDSAANARSRIAGFIEHFGGSYSSIDARAISAWGLERLGHVSRVYHRKERSSARVFLAWAHAKGHCSEPPIFPPLPVGNVGVRATTQKREAVVISDEQMEALLDAMPERSHGGGGNKAILIQHAGHELPLSQWARVYGVSETTLYYQIVKKGLELAEAVDGRAIVVDPGELATRGIWVRPFREVVWETGLRPITVMRLEAGRHYHRGAHEMLITKDIDKIEFERVLPLTDRARAALDRAFPASGAGVIFGVHDYDKQLELAKRATRIPKRFTKYDVRHSRATDLIAKTGDMLGTSYLTGHTQLSTLARYTHARKHDAERVLGALAMATRRSSVGGNTGGARKGPARRKRAK